MPSPGNIHVQPILIGTVSVAMFANRMDASSIIWEIAGDESHVKEVFPEIPVGPLCV